MVLIVLFLLLMLDIDWSPSTCIPLSWDKMMTAGGVEPPYSSRVSIL